MTRIAGRPSLVHVDEDNPATRALAVSGLEHSITRHGRVASLAEAAAARGVDPSAIVKTMVVRRSGGDHLFVLVPGDRQISWPKLRALLGVNRISLPDADAARNVTGYERGTITPFGSATALPVVADERIVGQTISIGAGGHGVAATLSRRRCHRPLRRPGRGRHRPRVKTGVRG